MSKIVEKFEQQQIEQLSAGKKLDNFAPGDTVRVKVKIVEGANERLQAFEGLVIAINKKGLQTTFVVRKISHNQGVERIFPLYSPRIAAVELVKSGVVRRAKLYYIRERKGKAARIKEKIIRKKSDKN